MIIYSNIQPIKATKAGLRRQPKYPKITATIVMCIFANLNTITRGLSYRVGHLQQYYKVLLICQSTKAYHLQLCILFIQKLPSISRQKPLSRSDKDRLADKRIPHKGIFPTSNSVARIWISYLYSQWTLVTQIAQETI